MNFYPIRGIGGVKEKQDPQNTASDHLISANVCEKKRSQKLLLREPLAETGSQSSVAPSAQSSRRDGENLTFLSPKFLAFKSFFSRRH